MQSSGVPVALVGSVFLAGGAMSQQRRVSKGNARAYAYAYAYAYASDAGRGVFSLPLAPLTVAQPLGALVVVQITHRQKKPSTVLRRRRRSALRFRGHSREVPDHPCADYRRLQVPSGGRRLDWLTVGCVNGLVLAALVGSHFVQLCCAGGSPDVVVAGLIVIDPIVGVTKGIAVLGKAAQALRGRLSPVRSPD